MADKKITIKKEYIKDLKKLSLSCNTNEIKLFINHLIYLNERSIVLDELCLYLDQNLIKKIRKEIDIQELILWIRDKLNGIEGDGT